MWYNLPVFFVLLGVLGALAVRSTHHWHTEHPMKVLLIEPYYGGSHRAWAEGYAAHSSHGLTLLTLPARFWKRYPIAV